MKKTLLALLSIAIAFTAMQPSQAEDQKVLAIIDTAIDSTKLSSVVYEVCFTVSKSCPNKTNFMEGKGSASAPWPQSLNNGTYHGDSMVKAAIAVNPNIKIVFVRFADVSTLGNSLGSPDALVAAIKWVSDNAQKHSIDAVSISQSSISVNNLNRCITDKAVISAVDSLTLNNIPTFAATGNDAMKNVVGFPSCIPGVIGVGALASVSPSMLETATNRGPGLDLVSQGNVVVTKYIGAGSEYTLAGSSGATAVAASVYVKNNNHISVQKYVDALPKIQVQAMDRSTKQLDPTFNPTVSYSSK